MANVCSQNTISENKIAIFSKSYCPYCKRAKSLLTSKFPDVQTKILELDEMDEGSAIQEYLAEKTGQRTVPNIFISESAQLPRTHSPSHGCRSIPDQKHVGGCDAVVSLDSQGKLASLVSA
ncbi:glutaredoxin [Cerioporus squamosus]|nr:glutaredoxin [Cerioporus squamosus]